MATKAAPSPREAARTRRRRASWKVRWATVRIARTAPGPRGGRPGGWMSPAGLLEEHGFEGAPLDGEMVEADPLAGQPTRHLGQPLLALHAQPHDASVVAQVAAETAQAREERWRQSVEAELHLEVAVQGAERHLPNHAPCLHEGHAVAGDLHLSEQVGVQEHGRPAIPQLVDQVAHEAAPQGVETGGGLDPLGRRLERDLIHELRDRG